MLSAWTMADISSSQVWWYIEIEIGENVLIEIHWTKVIS